MTFEYFSFTYFLYVRQMDVSCAYHIELPRSLVEVVTHWNLPMHHWLKTCEFIR